MKSRKNLTTAEGGAPTWLPLPGIDNAEIYKMFQLLSLHVLSQITMSDVEYPYICFESTQNNGQYKLWPNCFHVRLVCSRHDRQIEKSLEDALVNCGFIFQIFRFRKRGQGSPYQVVYEFPYEKKQEDNHRIKRFSMQKMLRDSRGDFVEKMKEVKYGTAA